MRSEILNISNCKKIAVMGGTFDPIHYGHLVTAEAVREKFNIERVIFIPTGKPPHKKKQHVAHNEHRYLMTVLATVNNPYFDVSRIEIDRPGTTYTIDTIKEIRKICDKDTQIYFITGADAIAEILTWKNPEELLSLCQFVAVTRPGYNKENLIKKITDIGNKFEAKLNFTEVPALAISSTDIRNRVKNKNTIKYLLPEEVEKYILKFGIYKGEGGNEQDYSIINQKLHSILSPARFLHSQGVADEALKLAKVYGIDKEKAYLAGLLHDCAKDYPDNEKLRLSKYYKIKLDEAILEQISLVHSFLGAEIAKDQYSIENQDIINAIRYHTTGRANMSKLEKIIYLADFFEPNRKYFNGIDKIKELAYTDLDKAMKFALEHTINYNKAKNRLIHYLSVEALEYYKQF